MEDQNDTIKEETKEEDTSSRLRDAKAKEGARRHHNDRSTAVSPGAVAAKDGDNARSTSKRSSGGGSLRRRENRDREAKSKARSLRSESGSAAPGAVSATKNDHASRSSRRRGDRDREAKRPHKGSGASTPGAVSATNDDNARETARKRKEGRSSSSRGSVGRKDSEDRHREGRRNTKEKEAMAAVTPRSGRAKSVSDTAGAAPEEVPTASAIDFEEEPAKEEAYAVQGSLVAPEAPPVHQTAPMTPAPLGSDEAAAATSEEVEENKDRTRLLAAKPFFCKAWFWLALVFMLIGGAVAIVFLLQSGDSTDTISNAGSGDPTPGTNDSLNVTNATEPSSMPSLGPTEFITRYDPPSPDDCVAVADGGPTSQEAVLLQSFQVALDVELSEDIDDDEVARELEEAIRQLLMPKLMGCDTAVNRKLQQQLDQEVNYVIANAEVNVQAKGGECVRSEQTPCLPVQVLIDLSLKGPERQLTLIELISVVFGNGQDLLVIKLQLTTPYVQILVVTIGPVTATEVPIDLPSLSPSGVSSDIDLEAPIVPPSESPSSKPTSAPVVGPSPPPSASPTGENSLSPSGLPSLQVSSSPSLAPFPGPSPPLTPSPSKTPTTSPTPSPTQTPTESPTPSPTQTPTESPTPSPTQTPTESPTPSPTQTPTESPTKQASVVPTMGPTDRPTVAFDGQGVPVYGDWDNSGVLGADIGMYFLFVPSDWEGVFGSLPATSATTVYNVEQRRNDAVIWQGEVATWFYEGSRADLGVPNGFEHGRRNPYDSASNGQWQTGDIIVPRYVTPNVDWRNSWNSDTLGTQGRYFLFQWEDWEAGFGYDPRTASQQAPGIICRNGEQVKSADIQTFEESPAEGGYVAGRLVVGAANDIEGGDYLLPPGMACPKAIRPALTPVSITAASTSTAGSVSVGQGRFFFFDNTGWEQAFEGYQAWGDCPNADDCSTTAIINRDLAYFIVRQCRNGSEIWNGIVATSVNHFLWPSETRAVGRRHDGADGDFETGDTIIPFSRSCS